MTAARIFFEVVPLVLAVYAIFTCANRALTTRRAHDRNQFLLMIICAALMIGAQSSWTYTLLKGDILGTDVANVLWTVFNSLVMVTFSYAAWRVPK